MTPLQRRWLPLAIALVLAFVLGGWWLGQTRAPAPAQGIAPPNEARVTRGDLAAFVEATGRVVAERSARLSLPIGGAVTTIAVEVGDEVAAGATLLAVDPREYQLRLDEAQAGLLAAEAQLRRAEAGSPAAEIEAAQAQVRAAQLALTVAEAELDALPAPQQGTSEEAARVEERRAALDGARATLRRLVEGTPPEEREVLAAAVAQARARVAAAEAALAAATLQAPFAGVVTERLVAVGERANPSQPLLALADPATLVVAAEVDEVDVGRVTVGQAVTVTLDAFPTRPLPGTVERIAPAAGEPRGATTYRTVIRCNFAGLAARLDMAADLRIRTADATNTLLLPLTAIRYAETQPFVVVRRDGQPVEQDVTLGAQDDRMVEILEGVEEGETVIVP